VLVFRLVGCQDLMEDVGSRVSKHDNLLTVVTYPPDYKSLPRRSRGTNKYRGSRDDHLPSTFGENITLRVILLESVECLFLAVRPASCRSGISYHTSLPTPCT